MLKPVETFLARIDSYVRTTDDTIRLSSGDARQLDAIGVGNYMHILLRAPGRFEVVKYTHTQNYDDKTTPDEISVERDSCCRTSFAMCDSAEFIWLSEDILQLVSQNGDS